MSASIFSSIAVLCASVASFVADPAITDPRQIWHLETALPGNDLGPGMRARGLAARSSGTGVLVNAAARELIVCRLLERVNEIYGRRPDGTAIPGTSFSLTFVGEEPDPEAFPGGPGVAYSRICIGGRARTCGGILGTEYFDVGNREVEWQCETDRLGVFAGRICGLRSQLDPPLAASDLPFVDGSYVLGAGEPAEDARFVAVRVAIDDWATALGNVAAHEIGHALGLDHDTRRGHLMQAVFSDADLSDPDLTLGPASRRALALDVGYAFRTGRLSPGLGGVLARRRTDPSLLAPGAAKPGLRLAVGGWSRSDPVFQGRRPRSSPPALGASSAEAARPERFAVTSDLAATLGARCRAALSIVRLDDAGAVAEILKGRGDGDPGEAIPIGSGAGFLFLLPDGDAEFIGAALSGEREALGARIRGYLAGPSRSFLAAGLGHWHPRIATDAALELDRTAGPPEPGEAAMVEDVLLRNAGTFDDLRPVIRLAGRASATGLAGRLVDLAADPPDHDLTAACAEALSALGARSALLERIAGCPEGPGRTRLLRALLAMPETTIAERAALLEHPEPAVARAAATSLLTGDARARARLCHGLPRLGLKRRAEVEDFLRRPRLRW